MDLKRQLARAMVGAYSVPRDPCCHSVSPEPVLQRGLEWAAFASSEGVEVDVLLASPLGARSGRWERSRIIPT